MKRLSLTASILVPAVLLAMPAVGHMGATGVVKERMDAMLDIGKSMKAISRTIKSPDYNPETVAKSAGRISRHADRLVDMFPVGVTHEKSEARPAIWERKAEFDALFVELREKARKLSDADRAGDPKDAAMALRDLGKTCSACHKTFRKSTKRR